MQVYEYSREVNGVEIEFRATGKDWEKYYPAKLSGPPERCYPAEGGYFNDVEIILVRVDDHNPTQAEIDLYLQDEIDAHMDDIAEALANKEFSDDEGRREWEAEAKWERMNDR